MDELRRRARQLRNGGADAERCLWRYLRARQLDGFRFRRQVPIAGYIADLVCPQAKVIIELDGGQHSDQDEYDSVRTSKLEQQGYRVVRYWNHDVLQRTHSVLADILGQLTKSFIPPQPSPALLFATRKGGGQARSRSMKILVTGGGGRLAAFARVRRTRAPTRAPDMDARPDGHTMEGSERNR